MPIGIFTCYHDNMKYQHLFLKGQIISIMNIHVSMVTAFIKVEHDLNSETKNLFIIISASTWMHP